MRDIELTNLQRLKRELGIPLEDHAQDVVLNQIIREASLAIEKRVGYGLRQRRYVETILQTKRHVTISDVVALIALGVQFSWEYLQDTGQLISGYQKGLDDEEAKWLRNAKREVLKNPDRCFVRSPQLVRLQSDDLWCIPTFRTVLTLNDPQCSVSKGQPVEVSPEGFQIHRKLDLVFLRAGKQPSRMDVSVHLKAEKERIQYPKPKKIKKLLRPFTQKRIYFPSFKIAPPNPDPRGIVHDNIALSCLYLWQGEFFDQESEAVVYSHLVSYLKKFRRVEEVGSGSILDALWRAYQIPEDYRAWTKYIARTIHGLRTEQQGKDAGCFKEANNCQEAYRLPAAAERIGLSKRTLYHLVETGKVKRKNTADAGSPYLTIEASELEKVAKDYEQRDVRRRLIDFLATKRGISKNSARRWVERNEKKGLGMAEMMSAAAPESVEKYLTQKT